MHAGPSPDPHRRRGTLRALEKTLTCGPPEPAYSESIPLASRLRPFEPRPAAPPSHVIPYSLMAHALTSVRLLLAVPFGLLMAQAGARRAAQAALVMLVAIATDLLDGPLARRRGTVTATGAAFDHTADCLFVTSGLVGGASRGAFPWALPVLVAAAFVQYVLDSYWLYHGRALRANRLGRWNGILYFVPPAIEIAIRLGLEGLQPLLPLLVWGLVLSTLASMGGRLWALRAQLRRSPGSLAGERKGLSPR